MVFLSSVNTPFFSAHHARLIRPLPKHLRPVLPTNILQYAKAGFHDSSACLDNEAPVLPPLKLDLLYSESEVSDIESESDRDLSPGPEETREVDGSESCLTAAAVETQNEDEEKAIIPKAEKLIAYISDNVQSIRNPSLKVHATLVLDAILRIRQTRAGHFLGARFVLDMLQDLPDALAEDAARDVEIEDAMPLSTDEPPVQYAPAYPADEEVVVAVNLSSKAVTDTMVGAGHHLPAVAHAAAVTPTHHNSASGLQSKSKHADRTSADIDQLLARMESCSVTAKPSVGEVIRSLCSLLEGMNVTTAPTSMPTSPTSMKRRFDDASLGDEGDDEDWGQERPIKRSRSYKERAVKNMGLPRASKTPCSSGGKGAARASSGMRRLV